MSKYTLSVFTKPWKDIDASILGEMVAGMGFDAVEFPLREGYQAEPATAETSLPLVAGALRSRGIKIASVASSTDENIFAACQNVGVPIIRIMLHRSAGVSYTQIESQWKKQLYDVQPLCEKYGVKVSVQQHFGGGVFNSMELYHVLEGLDHRLVGGIWDAAHSGLAGETPEKALDILSGDILHMVNFKSAYFRCVSGPEAEQAVFRPYFTTAKHGATDWAAAVAYLKSHGYEGTVCMPAEYTDIEKTIPYLRQDVKYLKSLLDS